MGPFDRQKTRVSLIIVAVCDCLAVAAVEMYLGQSTGRRLID